MLIYGIKIAIKKNIVKKINQGVYYFEASMDASLELKPGSIK